MELSARPQKSDTSLRVTPLVLCQAKLELGGLTPLFDQPEWKGNDIKSEIIEDFYLIAKSITSLTKAERDMLYDSYNLNFEDLRALLKKNGYTEAKGISEKLIELYSLQNKRLEKEIHELTKKKIANAASNKLSYILGMAPATENTDKILKYERSLQKSIFQNLFMLKKLQGSF